MSYRILIDGSTVRRGGGFTYLVNLVPALARRCPEHHFGLVVRDRRARKSLPDLPNLEVIPLPESGWLGVFAFTYLRAARLARRWGADLYFATAEFSPPGLPCPSIASFRNPNVFDQYRHRWRWRQRLRLRVLRALARLSARLCTRVLFVSADSARWLGDAAGVAPERRFVVHHGVDVDAFAAPTGAAPLARPYILSVSTIYRYKNFVALIEAWCSLAARDGEIPDLVIVGDDMDPVYSDQMRAARAAAGPLGERIHLVGAVPYADVRAWYSHASLFVFPSYLETFGHPMVEAMASGLPVVAADIPVFREIAGDVATFADPFDVASMADAIGAALRPDPELRASQRQRSLARAREFTWDRCADTTTRLFNEVLGGS